MVHVRNMVAGDGIYSAHLICKHALSALRTKVDGRSILCSLMCGKTARFERKRAGVCFEFRASQNPLLCLCVAFRISIALGTGVGDLLSGAARRAPVHGRGGFHAPVRLLYHDTLRPHSLISMRRQSPEFAQNE